MNHCPDCDRLREQLRQLQADYELQQEQHLRRLHDWQEMADERVATIARLTTERDALRRVADGLLEECPRREAIQRLRRLAQDAPSDVAQKLNNAADALEALDDDE